MVICIAGKSEIAVNALQFILKNKLKDSKVVGLPNSGDDGVNGWQPSFKSACIKLNVPLVTLQDCYIEKKLIFISLESIAFGWGVLFFLIEGLFPSNEANASSRIVFTST